MLKSLKNPLDVRKCVLRIQEIMFAPKAVRYINV